MRKVTSTVCSLLAMLGAAACSDGDADITDPGTGGSDATTVSSSSSSGSGGAQATVAGEFVVDVDTLWGHLDKDYRYSGANGFYSSAVTHPSHVCPSSTPVGSCEVASCDVDDSGSPAPTHPSLGAIDISGPSRTFQIVPPSYLDPTLDTSVFYGEGESIHIALAGDGPIPAHEGSVVSPHRVTVSPNLGAVPFDGTQDVALSFSGGVEGQVVFSLSQTEGDGFLYHLNTVVCRFDASATEGVIPAAALANVASPGEYVHGSWSIDVINDTVLDLGPWTTTLRAQVNAIFENGNLAAGADAPH